jgi:hypothetical protein
MEFFVSKNHNTLNRRQYSPELLTPRLCLNPKYGVRLERPANEMEILLDSGAFQDISDEQRLTPEGALERQLRFEGRVGFRSSYLVSYDRIVDERITVDGQRRKKRVGSQTAQKYVDETIDAAQYLSEQRKALRPRRLVLSNQGVTSPQYVGCVKEVVRFAEKGDVIGLGGFCIIGQVPRLIAGYFRVLQQVLPVLERHHIRRLHLFGVGTFRVLIKTQALCHKYGIEPSYDTSALEFNAAFGKAFVPDTMGEGPRGVHVTRVFDKKDKFTLYHPRDWALLNIRTVNYFWSELNQLYPIKGVE